MLKIDDKNADIGKREKKKHRKQGNVTISVHKKGKGRRKSTEKRRKVRFWCIKKKRRKDELDEKKENVSISSDNDVGVGDDSG